ncbi:MAG TPA: phage holin family protein [Streptosporangiaceae bacterium]
MYRVKLLIRVVITAVALWVATLLVSGIEVQTSDTATKILTLLVVAVIVGVINGVLKPIIKTVGCAFYVVTLGLLALVVNGLLLWLASYVCGLLTLPFHITGFWPALWGALIVGIVSWLLNLFVSDDDNR